MEYKTGVVDEANPRGSEDKLDIGKHADALFKFIKGSPTPMTIGIQGEWGSGKTSLLNTIFHKLQEEGTFKQIWINSWESSLLSTPEESLLKIINEIIDEMLDADADKSRKDNIKKITSTIFKGALRVGASIALGDKAGQITEELLDSKGNSIKQLRQQLNDLTNEVMLGNTNPYKKIIVYVDDLDRIEPKDAVKILELLKNIFSIPSCIFILAIDYQVVVKGLENKFGKRSEENEWEFRAFFDKIIQLPFMMPMGQYNIGKYISSLLDEIGFVKYNELSDEQLGFIVDNSIGGNPRSLKRLTNSLSLINIFLQSDEIRDNSILSNPNKKTLLFAIVCIQIAYPGIYDLLSKHPDFITWNDDVAYGFTKLKEEEDKEKFLKALDGVRKTDDFDDQWEQALFRICYITPKYYKRVVEISKLLNFIKDVTLIDEKEELEDLIASVISETSVTSISSTDDIQTNTQKHSRVRFEGPDEYIINILQNRNIQPAIIDLFLKIIKKLEEDLGDKLVIQYAPSYISLNIDTKRREKTFVALHVRKKFILFSWFYMTELEIEEILKDKLSGFNNEFTVRILNEERLEIKNITNFESYVQFIHPLVCYSNLKFDRQINMTIELTL